MWLCKRKKMESIEPRFIANKGTKRVKSGRGVCDDPVVGQLSMTEVKGVSLTQSKSDIRRFTRHKHWNEYKLIVTVLKYELYLGKDKKTQERARLAEPSWHFQPEQQYCIYFKKKLTCILFISQFNIKLTASEGGGGSIFDCYKSALEIMTS